MEGPFDSVPLIETIQADGLGASVHMVRDLRGWRGALRAEPRLDE